jgi:hypothetical protein
MFLAPAEGAQLPHVAGEAGFGKAAAPRTIPSQLVILALVLGISTATLFAMRAYGMRTGLTFEALASENFQSDSATQAAEYERIMADLTRMNKPLEVALNDYGHSPFMARFVANSTDVAVATSINPSESAQDREARERSGRKATLMSEVSRLEVHSVLGGRVPLARIGEKTVGLGDKLGSFTVAEIEGRGVTLEAEGFRFNLTMKRLGEGGTTRPNRTR